MRKSIALAAVSAAALTLAACGGSADESEDMGTDTAAEEVAAEDEVVVEDGETEDTAEDSAEETDAAEDEADDEPAPAATASATPTPTPTPTRVAAAGPPASFTTCGVCHSVNAGENRIGPSLAGVVGRRAGSVSGANYSPAMQEANITWNEANLGRYLADPASVVPGGTMPNPNLDAAQRRAIIDYLKTL